MRAEHARHPNKCMAFEHLLVVVEGGLYSVDRDSQRLWYSQSIRSDPPHQWSWT